MQLTQTANDYQILQGSTLYTMTKDCKTFKKVGEVSIRYSLSGKVVRDKKLIFIIQNKIKNL